jgi:heat shock protein HtpX
MISALRKIEGRGELNGATSAVMEMCVDNPREGFTDLFDTHPPVEKRIEALIKFAGGHDPGPLALDAPAQTDELPAGGPWGTTPGTTPAPTEDPSAVQPQGARPFLPDQPPVELGGGPRNPGRDGPWGPHE